MKINKVILIAIFCILTSCGLKNSEVKVDKKEIRELQLIDSLTTIYKKGDIEGSLKGVRQFMLKNPKSDYGFNLLATINLAKNEDSLALVNVKKALDVNPDNYGALTNYGIVLDRYEKYMRAFSYYKQAIKLKPDYPQAYSNLMGNRVSVGDLESARKYGEKAVYYGNAATDKGLLCAIYHKLELHKKRDNLYKELKILNYTNISELEEIISPD